MLEVRNLGVYWFQVGIISRYLLGLPILFNDLARFRVLEGQIYSSLQYSKGEAFIVILREQEVELQCGAHLSVPADMRQARLASFTPAKSTNHVPLSGELLLRHLGQ